MADESSKSTTAVDVQTSPKSRKDPPPWMAQAVLVLAAWRDWKLVDALRGLRWQRQSRVFEAVDLVLLLILFGLSNERSVRTFFKHLGPHGKPLAALWGREKMPTRSGFMALLKAVDDSLVSQLRPLFCPTSQPASREMDCAV